MDKVCPENYEPSPDLLAGRHILITGAGDGIGAALSRACANHGATVVLLGRTQSKLEKVYDQIVEADHPRPGIFVMDLERAGPDDYDQLSGAVMEAYGKLDGIVHNAGILGDRSPIEHYDVATWQRVMHINLTAPFVLTRTLFHLLRRSDDASVIFTSSGVGRIGKPFWGAYAVSKFGTEGLMQVLASEVDGSSNIRANAINPGPTRTAMRRAAYPGEDPESLKAPEEILSPYLFLLGPDGKSLNGKSLDAQ
ncbi:MAG: YciK family oxidoreductase [Gammaproteobacteria bacterium]|jgi:NAD(P)-dependent dehydrogenase (short-subunit alcohol dehydrogenase family)